ncbi:MAG: UDP-2,3-diacylglucosamine diphosphatase, partial [Bacteroidales bacterium]|nr:UDP-2,3-diacylglucosamine diphosphatase [Bacteroidales bacterium]
MTKQGKIYFISDLHLGVDAAQTSIEREKKFVQWLDFVSKDATEIYLLGDIFDMWFEYKHALPRGFSRVLGKFAELADSGILFHYFTGNHDMWVKTYFSEEMGMKIYRQPIVKILADQKFLLGHGDGLGRGDYGYKL